MTQEALRMALDALETELSIDWTNNDEFNTSAEKMYEAIAAIKQALAQEKEPTNIERHELEAAYLAGFKTSAEGYNGEYPFEGESPEKDVGWLKRRDNALREALAQPEQEPVAWMNEEMDYIFFDTERPEPFAFDFWKPLYTTPPQRTWVGLTDEERSELVTLHHGWNEYGQAIEAKLKEKNFV